jgi:hypothetical protein
MPLPCRRAGLEEEDPGRRGDTEAHRPMTPRSTQPGCHDRTLTRVGNDFLPFRRVGVSAVVGTDLVPRPIQVGEWYISPVLRLTGIGCRALGVARCRSERHPSGRECGRRNPLLWRSPARLLSGTRASTIRDVHRTPPERWQSPIATVHPSHTSGTGSRRSSSSRRWTARGGSRCPLRS